MSSRSVAAHNARVERTRAEVLYRRRNRAAWESDSRSDARWRIAARRDARVRGARFRSLRLARRSLSRGGLDTFQALFRPGLNPRRPTRLPPALDGAAAARAA